MRISDLKETALPEGVYGKIPGSLAYHGVNITSVEKHDTHCLYTVEGVPFRCGMLHHGEPINGIAVVLMIIDSHSVNLKVDLCHPELDSRLYFTAYSLRQIPEAIETMVNACGQPNKMSFEELDVVGKYFDEGQAGDTWVTVKTQVGVNEKWSGVFYLQGWSDRKPLPRQSCMSDRLRRTLAQVEFYCENPEALELEA